MNSPETYQFDASLEQAQREINRWQSVRHSLEHSFNTVDEHNEDLLRAIHELLHVVYDMELLVRFCVHEGLVSPVTDELRWQQVESITTATALDVTDLRTLCNEMIAYWQDGVDQLNSEPDEHHGTSERGRYEIFREQVPQYDRS